MSLTNLGRVQGYGFYKTDVALTQDAVEQTLTKAQISLSDKIIVGEFVISSVNGNVCSVTAVDNDTNVVTLVYAFTLKGDVGATFEYDENTKTLTINTEG